MKPLPDGLVIRPAERSDDEQMRSVLAASFPTNAKTRPEISAWQWWDNPFGESMLFVCVDGDRVVSQGMAVCLPGNLAGSPGTLGIGVDLATLPSHRGMGLARHMIDVTFGTAVDKGIPLYMFPNEKSMTPLTDGGWVPVTPLDVRVLPTDPAAVLDRLPAGASRLSPLAAPLVAGAQRALRRRGRAPADRAVDVSRTPPDDVDGLWDQVAHQHPWGVARHGHWWRWRYGERPGDDYRIVTARVAGRLTAVAAVSSRDDLGGDDRSRFHCILDLLALDEADARAVVSAIADGAVDDLAGPASAPAEGTTAVLTGAQVAGVATMAVPGSRLSTLTGAAGLVRIPNRLLPRPSMFGVVPAPPTLSEPRGLDWATAWGDVDHV